MTTNEQKKVTEESYTLTEAQMKKLARNALLTAGHEMGAKGDHWPVIKNTITDIMMDWEKLDQEREVQNQMKTHLYHHLEEMETNLKGCTQEEQEAATPLLQELREVYDAFFTEREVEELYLSNDDKDDLIFEDTKKPDHIKRAEAILDTLMEEEDDE